MPITVTVTAETVPELANVLSTLAAEWGVASSVPPIIAAAAIEQLAEPTTFAQATAKPRATRAKKAEPAPEPEAPADDGRIATYLPDGTKFSSFGDAEKAAKWLGAQIAAAVDGDALNGIVSHNVEAVSKLSAELQDASHNTVDDRYNELEGDVLVGGSAETEVTHKQAEEAFKAFIKAPTGGIAKAKEILLSFKVQRLQDLDAKHYAAFVKKLEAA